MKKQHERPSCGIVSVESSVIMAASTLTVRNSRNPQGIKGSGNANRGEWKDLWDE